MRSLLSAQPFRTITISSSATTPYTRALMHYARRRLGSRRSKRASFKRADFKPPPKSSCAIFNAMMTWGPASTPMPQSGRSMASLRGSRRDADTLWRIPGSADCFPGLLARFPGYPATVICRKCLVSLAVFAAFSSESRQSRKFPVQREFEGCRLVVLNRRRRRAPGAAHSAAPAC
jgi:hypothetical protein